MTLKRLIGWFLLFAFPLVGWFVWPTPYRHIPADPAAGVPAFRISRFNGAVERRAPDGSWEAYARGHPERTMTPARPGTPNTPGKVDQLKRHADDVVQQKEAADKALEKEIERATGQ